MEQGVFGEQLYEGVIDALDFLKGLQAPEKASRGKQVVVIGGGYAAVDAARAAVRQGSAVHLIYRRTEKDLPVEDLELQAAREEGVQFHFLTAPTKILARNNRVSGVECIQLEATATDTSGRHRVLPKEGSEFTLPADLVLMAVGLQPDLSSFGSPSPASRFPPGRPWWWIPKPCRPGSRPSSPGGT